MKKLLDKIVPDNMSNTRYILILAFCFVWGVIDGIACGWLYNITGNFIFALTAFGNVVMCVIALAFIGIKGVSWYLQYQANKNKGE